MPIILINQPTSTCKNFYLVIKSQSDMTLKRRSASFYENFCRLKKSWLLDNSVKQTINMGLNEVYTEEYLNACILYMCYNRIYNIDKAGKMTPYSYIFSRDIIFAVLSSTNIKSHKTTNSILRMKHKL